MNMHLEDLVDSMRVDMDLMVVKKEPTRSTRGDQFQATLIVADRTGSVMVKRFGTRDECGRFLDKIDLRRIYRFGGRYDKRYNTIALDGEPRLADNPDRGDFERDIGVPPEIPARLGEYTKKIKNGYIASLLDSLFSDDMLKKRFLTYPAATKHHHARDNGLAEHVLEMLGVAETICCIYPKMSRDLLFCGCILHDIGKTAELDVSPAPHYTSDGNYISHIPLGCQMVLEHISKLGAGFPDDLKRDILHMILSHHGKPTPDKPSFMEPRTPEAKALHCIDMLSAQISPAFD